MWYTGILQLQPILNSGYSVLNAKSFFPRSNSWEKNYVSDFLGDKGKARFNQSHLLELSSTDVLMIFFGSGFLNFWFNNGKIDMWEISFKSLFTHAFFNLCISFLQS